MREIKPAAINGFIRCFCLRPDRKIFDEKYLAYRLQIFKDITLQSFREQTDRDFNLLLLNSVHLAQKYKDALAALAQENAFLKIIYIDAPDNDFSANDCIGYLDDVFINFVIDNDDAVPKDFIARLRPFLHKQFAGSILSIPQVSVIQRIKPDRYLKQDSYEIVNSIGLAYVTDRSKNKFVYELGVHSQVHLQNQVILLRGRGGLRIINGRNLENELDLDMPAKKCTLAELRQELAAGGYADFDFRCLAVCPDRRLWIFVVKSIRYIRRMLFERNRQPVFRRTVR